MWLPLVPIDELNDMGNVGSQSFSADGRYMFFVLCNGQDGYGSCDIYYSINTNGIWGHPIIASAPVNSQYWETNPVMSPAGNELFFVTDREPNMNKGNRRSKDIWRCDVKILDGGWLEFSNAKNLGEPINTDGDDFAPFIHADNQTLYFASDGHSGLGGSDIFVSQRNENGFFSEPKNLGYPINTAKDEFGIVVSAKGNHAYISSWNNENPQRRLDIYQFELYPAISPKSMSYVVGNVFDAVSLKKLDAQVEVYDYFSQKTISKSLSDKKTGAFTIFLPDTAQFSLNVSRTGYLFYSSKIVFSNDTLRIALQPIKKGGKIILNNVFFAFNSSELESKSEKEINEIFNFLQKNPNIKLEICGHTDNIGNEKFNLVLSENRAATVRNALINKGISSDRLTSKGFGFSQPVASNDTEENRERNRRVECVVW
jgi:outer membrane protein OmpA-like peptidoglycan-associated protein